MVAMKEARAIIPPGTPRPMAILPPVLSPEELSGVVGVVVDGLGGPLGWAEVLELGVGESEGLGLALVL